MPLSTDRYGDKSYFSECIYYTELRLVTRCYCCSQRSCLPWALPHLCGVAPRAQTWERSLQKIRRTVTSLLFLTESGPYEHWKQNCLPYVLNTGYSASIEENEWKAYHAQVRMHGRRMNMERSKGRIINRHWWRLPASKGAIGTETSTRSRNWNAVRQQLGNLAAEVHSSSLSSARSAERMTSCCRFPC